MIRLLRIAGALLIVQATLAGAYWVIKQRRWQGAPDHLGTAPPKHLSGPMPRLVLTRRDGSRNDLQTMDRRMLVHFWATWCPPCRQELPELLALSAGNTVDVVTIALDDDWAKVDRFLDGHIRSNVFLGDPTQARNALGVHTLPVTFLVESGQLRLRFDGARDWARATFSDRWLKSVPLQVEE